MKYALVIPLGMVAGMVVGQWFTGYRLPDKMPGADTRMLTLLAFVVGGGALAASVASSRWWDRRKK
jgi:hypothetical protein